MLQDICLGSSSKMSILKMEVVRGDEFLQYFGRIRQCLRDGLIPEADSLIATVAE